MPSFWSDVRQAVRASQQSPCFTAAAVLSIGLAVGSGAAVFSSLDGLVLHPFPAVTDQTRLVGLEVGPPNGGMGAWSYQTFKELRDATRSFTRLAAWRIIRVSAREPDETGSVSPSWHSSRARRALQISELVVATPTPEKRPCSEGTRKCRNDDPNVRLVKA